MKLELLAPAKNLEFAKAAIDCGADAVYIGADSFGARVAASNSLEEIAQVVHYAHSYGVRVYVAMNTILYDSELEQAREQACALVQLGVDALIVQDMAYGMMGLDIALHGSTQMSCDSLERVQFLERCGFTRVVLERGLSLSQIEDIRRGTKLELEAFVHGAICVSTSGKCYMGHIVSGRSGNRGCCSQPCRSRFDLEDEKGNVIISNSHLLSLKDMNFSDHLKELAKAGVVSFKIEGRLKDMAYLRGSVVHYNKKLEELLRLRPEYGRVSQGVSRVSFDVDVARTFNRGFTTYNLLGKGAGVASFDSGKSRGVYVGKVVKVGQGSFTIKDRQEALHSGDGLMLIDSKGVMATAGVNKASDNMVWPNSIAGIEEGMTIYRNYDKWAVDSVVQGKLERKIDVALSVLFSGVEVIVSAEDVYGYRCEISVNIEPQEVQNMDRYLAMLKQQMAKSGATIFSVVDVTIQGEPLFMATSVINNLRRELLEKLQAVRVDGYKREGRSVIAATKIEDKVDYRYNVSNKLSHSFYNECGVESIECAVELKESYGGVRVMSSNYCLRKEIGMCLKEGGKPRKLYIRNGKHKFALEFNCKECMMYIVHP